MVKKVTHCIFCDWSLFQNQNMAVGMHLNKKAEPGLGFFGELHVCMFYVFFLFFFIIKELLKQKETNIKK